VVVECVGTVRGLGFGAVGDVRLRRAGRDVQGAAVFASRQERVDYYLGRVSYIQRGPTHAAPRAVEEQLDDMLGILAPSGSARDGLGIQRVLCQLGKWLSVSGHWGEVLKR
jgi:hypothetical protein